MMVTLFLTTNVCNNDYSILKVIIPVAFMMVKFYMNNDYSNNNFNNDCCGDNFKHYYNDDFYLKNGYTNDDFSNDYYADKEIHIL